jgi:hypothetical protein
MNLPPSIGHNTDLAAEVRERLEALYAPMREQVTALLNRARELPPEVNSDEEMAPQQALRKEMLDLDKALESTRETEKAPHLRRAETTDAFFFSERERLARRVKTGKAGAADILYARCDNWMQRKLAAEEARRREELRLAQLAEDEARRKREAEAQAAAEAAAAAARARKPENIAAHQDAAADHAVAAEVAKVDEMIAGDKLRDAEVQAAARPADMVRTRTETGMATMAKEAFAEVLDKTKLDKEALWPFINEEEIRKALRAWARTTSFKAQMAGAAIGHRPKTNLR